MIAYWSIYFLSQHPRLGPLGYCASLKMAIFNTARLTCEHVVMYLWQAFALIITTLSSSALSNKICFYRKASLCPG